MPSTRHPTRDLAVGATTLAGIIGLGVLMLVFGYAPELTTNDYGVTITMQQSGGLNPGADVKLAGIKVGKVRDVAFAPGGPSEGVVVTAAIDAEHRIPEGSVVRASVPPLGGGATANITPPPHTGDQPQAMLPTDGSATLEGKPTPGLAELGEQLESFTALTSDFQTLSQEWKSVGANLNDLLEIRNPADVDAAGRVANLSTLVQRLDARVAETKDVVDAVRELVGDPAIRDDIRTTVRNAADVSESVGDTVRAAHETIDSARDTLGDLRERFVVVADEVSAAVGQARTALNRATEGEGSIARLLNDPRLTDNLTDATERLQKALDEARLLIQKWKTEGLPVQF